MGQHALTHDPRDPSKKWPIWPTDPWPIACSDSHLADTATMAGVAADKAASSAKETKYRQLANSHVFVPVAIAETWNHLAVELTQQLGRRIAAVTDDPRETGFLFQRLSVALQRGNAVSFRTRRCGHFAFTTTSSACWFCAGGQYKL